MYLLFPKLQQVYKEEGHYRNSKVPIYFLFDGLLRSFIGLDWLCDGWWPPSFFSLFNEEMNGNEIIWENTMGSMCVSPEVEH